MEAQELVVKAMKSNAPFNPSKMAEREFVSQLRKIARVSGAVVEVHLPTISHPKDFRALLDTLQSYSDKLTPWAMRQSQKMLQQVSRSNKRAYNNKSKLLGLALRHDVGEKAVGKTAQDLMFEQVELIKSIPIEAGLRAQQLSLEAFYNGTRADEIAQELLKTTEVTEARAILIGRTETARANASINQSRAVSLGSNQYKWHNSGDEAVRPSHKYITINGRKRPLQGMVFSWDDPPTLDDGTRIHPGTIYNCRCFAEGLFPEE